MLVTPARVTAQEGLARIVVFGTSLSDPGNAFALYGGTNNPPYGTLDPFLVPNCDDPYARGGHHLSNGATWIEQFARSRGLAAVVGPAFRGSDDAATNYAVCGARAYDDGINVNLSAQVSAFLGDVNNLAPSDALYVVEFGPNDIRDALAAFASGGDGGPIINAALTSIFINMQALYLAGARKFLVWRTPNVALTPAAGILDGIFPGAAQLAAILSEQFNSNLDALLASLGLPGIEITRLDVFAILNDVVADPGAFGLSVVDTACVTPNIPPFTCRDPDEYLFWDGIHPTKVAHRLLAQETAAALGLQGLEPRDSQ
jgi:phospholipase/lecithinase/hemolysin